MGGLNSRHQTSPIYSILNSMSFLLFALLSLLFISDRKSAGLHDSNEAIGSRVPSRTGNKYRVVLSGVTNVKRNPVTGAVDEVAFPGVLLQPTIGKLLHVYLLSNERLMGKFVANDVREVHLDSASSGWVRIYCPNGTTILQHQYLQHELNVHYAKIEGSAFVYGKETKGLTQYTSLDPHEKPSMNINLGEAGMTNQTRRK